MQAALAALIKRHPADGSLISVIADHLIDRVIRLEIVLMEAMESLNDNVTRLEDRVKALEERRAK
jgi:hypothetical protein